MGRRCRALPGPGTATSAGSITSGLPPDAPTPSACTATCGSSTRVPARLLRSVSTLGMPDRVIYKACGNRRTAACPSCAETYRRDAYHLIRSGLIGGKGVPETVATHPAVFATFTAPSFGTVHTRAIRHAHLHRPGPLHLPPGTLPRPPRRHHLPAWPADRLLHPPPRRRPEAGPAAVPGLLRLRRPRRMEQRRRGTVAAHQASHRTPPRLPGPPPWPAPSPHPLRQRQIPPRPPVRVSHGKAAEFQARGAVHFHALLAPGRHRPRRPGRGHPATARNHRRRPGRRRPVRGTCHPVHHPSHPIQPDGWPIAMG